MIILELVEKIKSAVSSHSGVSFCFGNPQKVDEMTVIPVAKVAYGIGFGGGSSRGRKKNDTEETEKLETETTPNEGGGGGGGSKSQPLGIFVFNKDKIKFYPVISIRDIAALFGIVGVLFLRLRKLRMKKVKK